MTLLTRQGEPARRHVERADDHFQQRHVDKAPAGRDKHNI